jgi:dTDP-glucose 4,6-dehydratase
MQSKKGHLLVTGAAGFIGSAFIREALTAGYRITVLDALTYAGHLENINPVLKPGECDFVQGNIADPDLAQKLFADPSLTGVLNFAAESHVDNSISGPRVFAETNIMGTLNLLEAARKAWSSILKKIEAPRFLHISTDEVFGSLGAEGKFSESTSYAPNSPYSASKAASDHLVRAWHHTYGLNTITTNCSNNYGPRQFPEKLIPVMIRSALNSKPLPVYGKGQNIRDWIHVEDHARGVLLAFERGQAGGTYCFGGNSERTNMQVVQGICSVLDRLKPRVDKKNYADGISYVQDRAGHDFRYAINDSLAVKELGFTRKYSSFEVGLEQTIQWYLENTSWAEAVLASAARKK